MTFKAAKPKLILASASPRRHELLSSMGCDFKVQIADIDESRLTNEAVGDYVVRVAKDKAQTILQQQSDTNPMSDVAVLAADTIVSQGDALFSKPRDKQDAQQMWRQLANSEHQVMTAVCLAFKGRIDHSLVSSAVTFSSISDAQMNQYWDSGEPQDKAGGYAIQGLASAWVTLIHGSYSNVVGLPLRETNQLLHRIGHHWL